MMALIAFEGVDQSGKETQSRLLRGQLERGGRRVASLTFPDDGTPIGREIRVALSGERQYPPDVMQLLYIANRHERRAEIRDALDEGTVVICDRYLASSIAYGEASGLDPAWLSDIQRFLPVPSLTIFLDIAPETAVARKQSHRDQYERDTALLARVRESYRRQAGASGWARVDGERPREEVATTVRALVAERLGLR
jgi:dTMP kinase